MALFKQNKKKTVAELEDYYAKQETKSTFMAWVMAFLSLFITVAALAILFFGGRWLYRTLTDDGDNSAQTSQSETSDVASLSDENNGEQSSQEGSAEGQVNGNEGESLDEGSSSQNTEGGGVVDGGAAVTTESNADRVAAQETGDDSSIGGESATAGASTDGSTDPSKGVDELTNTGPAENLIALIIATAALGYLGSLKLQAVKNN